MLLLDQLLELFYQSLAGCGSVDAPRSSVGKVRCPSGQRTQVRTPVAEWSGKSNCGRMAREVKSPGELDTTDTHTDARSAKKDVISTKPQKAMGAERTFPREGQRKGFAPSPCAVTLAKCRRYRGTLSCAVRASEGEAQSHLSYVRVGSVPSLGEGPKGQDV